MAMKAIRLFVEAGHCTYFQLSTPKFKIDKEFASGLMIFLSFVDTTVKFLPALFNLCQTSRIIFHAFIKEEFSEISNILKESAYFNFMESIFMMPYFKQIKIFNGPV